MTKAQNTFWTWFRENEQAMAEFGDAGDRHFDELANRLRAVDEDITFEIGPRGARRELIISAGGIKRAFPSVSGLVAAAPILASWNVTAFRPRRRPISLVELGGKCVDPKGVQFTLVHNGKIPGVYLFIPNLVESDTDWRQIGYLLLDEALGEYDVESKLGLIEMLPTDAQTQGDRHPLSDLAPRFDALVEALKGPQLTH